ncbi:L,D-transpeptidase family protein [Ketogulonicigenium vulgare]|uniref:L,D-TPase catalytic domain-containing protein n=1 Tax=Ketogulonicigenium vulgare (strain WSH-001) TaxID=759362 RepID=F9Y6N3_KETVW|nr:L,D-transpeptidase family protein [Ketogulonicigenium vulgare]ADO43895.1 conserved hypothetical protein [Ketogulonicigenium vulgare Y25]AEM42153.1 hypothetical protein KVU_2314 [Ketogulonicigenium vulgare WSH-001]ALJ79777.1 hypothetical protein KVH_00340 [Ketogulonicigenium vulgare]ANW32697.1 hypothetical protein KvSKV_00350 [Ketogulonicigenium vulgare]AOZ55929.1 hypothetical protein KVC_2927 [Ketogulonicigenium vulgare]
MAKDVLRLTPMGLIWRGRRIPCTIGRAGLSRTKHEGDGATPDAPMRLLQVLYRPDRLPPPVPGAKAIGPRDLWSDASGQPDYNHMVRAPYAYSHEAMRRPDPLYDIVIVTDWNYPAARAGGGSAIFLHQWRRRGAPTAGCIAMARANLIRLAREITPGTRLIITGMRLANGARATIFRQ